YMSTLISARCPGWTVANCVSLKLAVTHTSCNGMMVMRPWPGCTICPSSTDFVGHHAIHRGHQGGVAQLEFGRREVGARGGDTSRGRAAFGAAHVHLLTVGQCGLP